MRIPEPSPWSAPGTVAGFAQAPPNAVLMRFAQEDWRLRTRAARSTSAAGRAATPCRSRRMGWNVVGTRRLGAHARCGRTAGAGSRAWRRALEFALARWTAARSGPDVRPRDRARHLEPGALGRRVSPRGPRGGTRGEARRGAVRVHVLAEHARAGPSPSRVSRSCSRSSPGSRSAS